MAANIKYSVKTDEKWQKKWDEQNLYKFDEEALDKKLYCLEMFSYPSGANLHLGHWYNYAAPDTWVRFKRMNGYNVFHPQGFDAFGLPAENYAIKTGIHPEISTKKNIQTMTTQLKKMGATFNWEYSLNTCDESYYKWTQWIFLQMYKKGLAYRKDAPVNWCPKCNTVLANEQVINGRCDRCGTDVYQKKMNQWFFKITDYAEELLNKIDELDWPEKTKKIQKNWIGKSDGALISFDIKTETGKVITLKAFTSRADTLFGLSYVVLAPEHENVMDITYTNYKDDVVNYIKEAAKTTEIERMSAERKRSGVFTGAYAVNPINGQKVPVWVADYVIASYGTGFVMAVPAHDERDYDFAKNYNLPIHQVIINKMQKTDQLPFCKYGMLINSDKYTGLDSAAGIQEIVKDLEKVGKGKLTSMYRLRDWLVSRQRYWGTPIPVIYCERCGEVPVPEDQLPVRLPQNVEFMPTGDSPLKRCDDFMHTTCPVCGGKALREADTMDTFVDSSWYFLRYPDSHNFQEIFSKDKINAILPVDKYIGGQEHATMHLLYARFFTKVLRDLGYLDFDEPFLSLIHQGLILGPDGAKMSKSKGNTICPDDYISKYGSDVFRMYIEFAFAYTDGGPWNDKGIEGIAKFITRIENMFFTFQTIPLSKIVNSLSREDKELLYARNFALDNISKDIEKFQFNTAIARLMEYTNAIYYYLKKENINYNLLKESMEQYIIMLSPFAPHLAEELWEYTGHSLSVFNESWPTVDKTALIKEEINITVQINGRVRFNFTISKDASEKDVTNQAISSVEKYLTNKKIIKTILVPNKLVNIVVSD